MCQVGDDHSRGSICFLADFGHSNRVGPYPNSSPFHTPPSSSSSVLPRRLPLSLSVLSRLHRPSHRVVDPRRIRLVDSTNVHTDVRITDDDDDIDDEGLIPTEGHLPLPHSILHARERDHRLDAVSLSPSTLAYDHSSHASSQPSSLPQSLHSTNGLVYSASVSQRCSNTRRMHILTSL